MIFRRAVLAHVIVPLALCCIFSGRASAAQTTPKSVPCGVFAAGIHCVNPIQEGTIDGQWVGLIFRYDGTNGGPVEIKVVSVGSGGNGFATELLPSIEPVGRDGDRMSAAFRGGKLFVVNAMYLPGEAHCCFTHQMVRRFGFHNRRLVMEREASVRASASAFQIDEALKNSAH